MLIEGAERVGLPEEVIARYRRCGWGTARCLVDPSVEFVSHDESRDRMAADGPQLTLYLSGSRATAFLRLLPRVFGVHTLKVIAIFSVIVVAVIVWLVGCALMSVFRIVASRL